MNKVWSIHSFFGGKNEPKDRSARGDGLDGSINLSAEQGRGEMETLNMEEQ